MAASVLTLPSCPQYPLHQVIAGFYMSKCPPCNPRKRQRTELHPPPQAPSKRQKLRNRSGGGYIDTPGFWDSLSKIWLTEHALREFDRRYTHQHPSYRRFRRRVTRSFLAEQWTISQRATVVDLQHNASPSYINDIKRFAQHGGPDLSDLVDVRFYRPSFLATPLVRSSTRNLPSI